MDIERSYGGKLCRDTGFAAFSGGFPGVDRSHGYFQYQDGADHQCQPGSVDVKTGSYILDVFRELNKTLGLTIVIVTHDRALSKKATVISRILRILSLKPGGLCGKIAERRLYRYKRWRKISMKNKEMFAADRERKDESLLYGILIWAGILILAVMVWIFHRNVPFMMDDLWYSTNLATDGPLTGLGDIIEGQVWHFMNWGGRSITHGILQATLMTGELCADILNMGMFLMLAWMVCVTAGRKSPFWFLMAASLIIALNANVKMSMFWQAGTVNYVYSTAWILLFVWAYLRQVQKPESRKLCLVDLWMIPLGLMTGWSNENMGPACFILSVAAAVYHVRVCHEKLQSWMVLGSVTCLIGSIFVIVAPGNFVRSATIEKKALVETVYERFYSMLCAGTDFLFPAAALLVVVLLICLVGLGKRLVPAQWMLLGLAVLSYGAMVLSPHYPDRATFGTMVVCIVLIIWVLADICKEKKAYRTYVSLAALSYWCYAIYHLAGGWK